MQQIWVDMAEGDQSQSQPFESASDKEVIELIEALYRAFMKAGFTHHQALERLGSTEAIGQRYEASRTNGGCIAEGEHQ